LRRVSTIEAGLLQLQADDLVGKREQPTGKSSVLKTKVTAFASFD
jgi:hypothetical protein